MDLDLAHIIPSKLNHRTFFDPQKMAELTESIKTKGVLQPIMVRPIDSHTYELVIGERRYRAAKAAGLTTIPAVSRALSDTEVVECQAIENQQRADVHPLDEAGAYHALMRIGKYDAARIATKIGLSVKYVYDRIKLLDLTPELKDLFWKGRIQAGHAILLARLQPTEQRQVLGSKRDNYLDGGLFQGERDLYDYDDEGGIVNDGSQAKVCSVRELEDWIKRHVRFKAQQADAFHFPETVKQVSQAVSGKKKIIEITHEYIASDDVRSAGEARVYGERAWRRADGKEKSKTCERSVLGVIASGPGQGEAFQVCINKERCTVHWGAEIKARERNAKLRASGQAKRAEAAERREESAWQREQQRQERMRAAYAKALPEILTAVAEAVKKAPTRAKGLLAEIILKECGHGRSAKAASYVPRGTTAEDLVRHAAFMALYDAADSHWAWESFPKKAKAFGLDVAKLIKQHEPKDEATDGKTKTKKRKAT
jgi:ParB/RepB/Spo0J family partition protein